MPTDLSKYQDPLPVPPVLRPHTIGADGVAHYRLPIRTARARFHRDLPEAPIWGYWGLYPGPIISVDFRQRVCVEMWNELSGPYPFAASVIPPSANQLDTMLEATEETGHSHSKMELPDLRWTVLHLHGSPTPPPSDGWPDDAFLPGQSQIYHFPPQPRAALLWYHDHANMITRLNVFAGLAGLYVVRDDTEQALGLPTALPYEVPLVIQDRHLEVDQAKNVYTGRLEYRSSGSAAFKGDFNVVNGLIWPYLEVEPRQYRFRILNGSNGRIYKLKLLLPNGTPSTAEFTQIGVDAGFLPRPAPVPTARGLVLAPAERVDLLIDFSAHPPGTKLELINTGVIAKLRPVMEFRVGSGTPSKPIQLPKSLPAIPPPNPKSAAKRRQIVLMTEDTPHGFPMQTLNGKLFRDKVEEVVELGDTEIWEFINATDDEHPMHLHLVHFQILEREEFALDPPAFAKGIHEWLHADPDTRPKTPPGVTLSGKPVPPDESELGPKDTVRAPQNTVTRILAKFEPHAGRYVYHCHILEHEDMEMMRPFLVVPKGLPTMGHGGHDHCHA